MIKKSILAIMLAIPLIAQEADSADVKTPSQAAKRALLFPGGGQFYNDQPIKGSLLIGLALASAALYTDNAKKYNNYTGEDPNVKQGYLVERNKYGWWVGFVYIYGLLDAIVEAHLHPFKSVLEEDLEQPKGEEKEKQ